MDLMVFRNRPYVESEGYVSNVLHDGIIINDWISVEWEEFYNRVGTATIILPYNPENLSLTRSHPYYTMSSSRRIMVVDRVTFDRDMEGEHIITIECTSLEYLLNYRFHINPYDPKATIRFILNESNHTPEKYALHVYREITRTNPLIRHNQIRDVLIGGKPYGFPADSNILVPWISGHRFEAGTIMDMFEEILAYSSFGFRYTHDTFTESTTNHGLIRFDTYSPRDRFSLSSDPSETITFGYDTGNLESQRDLFSRKDYNNVFYVRGTNAKGPMWDVSGSPTTASDLLRRIQFEIVDTASMVDNNEETRTEIEIVKQTAREMKAAGKYVVMSDGEISAGSLFKYEVDYHLGDLVRLIGLDHIERKTRIVGYSFSYGSEGPKEFPIFEQDPEDTEGSEWLE